MNYSEILKLAQLIKPIKLKKKVSNGKWKSSPKTICNDKCSVNIEKIFPQIENIQIVHDGCILSRAATNAIVNEIKNKEPEEAKKIIINFRKMLQGKMLDTILPPQLLLFKKFSKFPSRWNCLLIGPNLILQILEKENF